MKTFLRHYAGRPTRFIGMHNGGDATAEERLVVSCSGGHRQHVGVVWAWFDGDWRAWPQYGFPIKHCGLA